MSEGDSYHGHALKELLITNNTCNLSTICSGIGKSINHSINLLQSTITTMREIQDNQLKNDSTLKEIKAFKQKCNSLIKLTCEFLNKCTKNSVHELIEKKNQLVLNITCDGSPYLRKITDYQTQIVRYFIGCDKYHQNEKWHCYAKLKQEELDVPLLKDLFEASAPVKEISHCNMIIPKVSKCKQCDAYHVNDGNVICGVIVEKPCPVCFIRIILECPFVAIKCIGVHNHPPPSPDKLPNGIKSNLQALIEQSIDDNDTTTLDSILSGNLIKAYFDKEFLPEVHSSLDNIDKLRYLVAKVASFWLDTNRCQFKLVKGELNEFEINRYDPEHHLSK
ncbi:2102_t:CDS:2 [Entrophospora sp. SA101]|nr:22120_t:CDS:2 [Entrophospora sp. SA101]CAJ0765127.1 2102_t:CDS:2 [Entrophospora sp. SA101]